MPADKATLLFTNNPQNVSFARAAVAAFVSRLDPTVPELADISTAVSEIVTNAVVHAYPENVIGQLTITIELENNTVKITVQDKGSGIADSAVATTPGAKEEQLDRLGIGLLLAKACVDSLTIESEKGVGTTIKMLKLLGQPRGDQIDVR